MRYSQSGSGQSIAIALRDCSYYLLLFPSTIELEATSGLGRDTAVTSPWLNVLTPVRTILSLDGQFGSGHAISASVVIQSLACVTRCFAARRGRTEPSTRCTCSISVLRLARKKLIRWTELLIHRVSIWRNLGQVGGITFLLRE